MLPLNDVALMRHFIGLDYFNRSAQTASQASNYPPFNISQIDEDRYVLSIAVAGFSETEVEIKLLNSVLTVRGAKPDVEDETHYLHRGLSFRDFERSFTLAEHIQVISADMRDGMLTINLERQVPESAKPRLIPIGTVAVASIASDNRL